MQTSVLLGLPLNNHGFYFFVFGATLVQYNLHYVSKKVAVDGSPRFAWTHYRKKTHYVLIAVGTLMIFYSLFTFELVHYFILLVLGLISFLYSFPFLPFARKKRLKDFGVVKIFVLSLVWTLVTVWFPASTFTYHTELFYFVLVKRFIFMFVLCLVFDIRDMKVDKEAGILTIPVLVGRDRAYSLSYALLIFFILIVLIENLLYPGRFLIPFLISVIATTAVIQYSKKNNSDITCLFGIDGMMLLQSILIWIFTLNG